MQVAVAGHTHGDEIVLIVCAAVRDLNNVVNMKVQRHSAATYAAASCTPHHEFVDELCRNAHAVLGSSVVIPNLDPNS